MQTLSPHTPSRHARLFELLRQHELAAATVQRLEVQHKRPAPARPEEQLRAAAVSSLKSAVA